MNRPSKTTDWAVMLWKDGDKCDTFCVKVRDKAKFESASLNTCCWRFPEDCIQRWIVSPEIHVKFLAQLTPVVSILKLSKNFHKIRL